jgi:hypothetical protein
MALPWVAPANQNLPSQTTTRSGEKSIWLDKPPFFELCDDLRSRSVEPDDKWIAEWSTVPAVNPRPGIFFSIPDEGHFFSSS